MAANANRFVMLLTEILCNDIMHQVTRHDGTNRHFTRDLGDFIRPQGLSYFNTRVIGDASLDEGHDHVQITDLAYARLERNRAEIVTDEYEWDWV